MPRVTNFPSELPAPEESNIHVDIPEDDKFKATGIPSTLLPQFP